MTQSKINVSHLSKYLLLPIIIWGLVILVFLNVKNIPIEFSDRENLVLRYFIKVLMTVIVPLGVIHLFFTEKTDFGIYFHRFSESFKLSLRSYAITGPAGISFLGIGLLGWGFTDWLGGLTLSIVYLIALYFVVRVTKSLPTRDHLETRTPTIHLFIIFSLITIIVAYFTYDSHPIIYKIPYYIFIVGFGEELLFRGYLQSSFNRFFGKNFEIANVKFGWGLIISALLFGLVHALTNVPPIWPWAVFTFSMGLLFGFIREKDGSIFSVVILHGVMDVPLAFIDYL